MFALESWQDAGKAAQMAQYHKAERHYLGITNAAIDDMVALWRGQLDVDGRVDLARGLWDTNIHEARIAAAKLLVQARLRPDQAAWDLIAEWVEQLDAWAIADQVCKAGEKRLVADPARLDQVETWTQSENLWARRSAFVITQPWTKQRSPKPEDLAVRERVLGWAEALAADRDWFIQNAIAFWLRDLSKKDPERVRAWLETSGETLKTFARKEASKFL
nr:DNA alkylation repair protein [Thioclava indica]